MGKKNRHKKQPGDSGLRPPPAGSAAALTSPFFDAVLTYALLFLLLAAPFIYLPQAAGEFENNPKMAFLQWGIGLLALAHLWRSGRGRGLRRAPLDMAVAAFVLCSGAALFGALNPWYAATGLLHWGACVLVYAVLVNTLKGPGDLGDIFRVLALGGGGVSAIGLSQHLWGLSWIPQLVPPASTFANRNMAAHFVVLCLAPAAGAVLQARRWRERAALLVSLPLMLGYLVCTQTRSAWLAAGAVGLILGGGAVPVLLRRRRALVAAAAGAVLVSGLLIYGSGFRVLQLDTGVAERLASIGRVTEGTAGLRLIWWRNTLEMAKDHPLLGVGPGNFRLVYPLYHRAALLDWTFSDEYQLARVHNDHLQVLAETGLAGFTAWLALFGVFFWQCLRVVRRGDGCVRQQALCLAAGVAAYAVLAFFSFPMERALPPVVLFVFFGLMSFLFTETFPERTGVWPFSRNTAVRIGAGLAVLVFLGGSFTVIRDVVSSDRSMAYANGYEEKGDSLRVCRYLEAAKEVSKVNQNIHHMVLQRLAWNYMKLGRHGDALEMFRQSLAAHPNYINAILNMGICYKSLRQYDEADKYFKRFVELVPDSPKGHVNIGAGYFFRKNYEKAIEHCQKAIALAAAERRYSVTKQTKLIYAEPHLNLARIYTVQKRLSEAIAECEQALKLSPEMDEARELLGALYRDTGQKEKAREVLEPLLTRAKKTAGGDKALGDLYQEQGAYDQALAAYGRALSRSPDRADVHYAMGLTYFQMGNPAEAEKAAGRALALDDGQWEACNLLGQIYIRQERNEAAAEQFQKALICFPGNTDVRFSLATTYLRLGKTDPAAREYESVLKADPEYCLANYNLGIIYLQRGQKQKARARLEAALRSPSPLLDVDRTRKLIAGLGG